MNLENLEKALKAEPSFRLKQAKKAIFSDLIKNWDEVSNLPKPLREELKKFCPLGINAEIKTDTDSSKALITLEDGNKIETVLMKSSGPADTRAPASATRNAVCVSCQVGCPLKCSFCATGRLGLTRSLTASEIVEQVLLWARELKSTNEKVDNVTFMGMGEPFLNYDEVLSAIRILNDKDGFNLGARHISISTSGIIEGINRLADEPLQLNLALSLHAPNTILRGQLMPINKTYELGQVLAAVKNYIKKTNRKVMIEYVMIAGVNDSPAQAKELAKVLKNALRHLFMVNLIEYNPTDIFKASSRDTISKFRKILEDEGVNVTQRFKFGRKIFGACGQLAGKN